MRYLFFDISSTCCGYAVMENNKVISADSFDFSLHDKKIHGDNKLGYILSHLKFKVRAILSTYEPDIIGVEDIFCFTVTGYKTLSMLRGIVLSEVFSYNRFIPLISNVNARSIRANFKLNVTSKNPKVKKQVVIDYINKTLKTNYEFKDNDITDAILGCLYLYHKFYKKEV
jgi:Holliday junction resolvasome RuvABC endonuclease subunit